MRLVVPCLFLLACSNPPFALRFAPTEGESQVCISDTGNAATECDEITMACKPVLSIRITPPNDPTVPYISVCQRLSNSPPQNKLCAIAGVTLPEPIVPVPEQILEVQMAIFPEDELAHDENGNPICPIVRFGANNLPMDVQESCEEEDQTLCPKVPAIGGRTYYYPGDDLTTVRLGCTYLEKLQAKACSANSAIPVSVVVSDFDSLQPVTASLASRLTVSIGEPHPSGDVFVLNTTDLDELMLSSTAPPTWSSMVPPYVMFQCADVREDAAQTTATVTCEPAPQPAPMRIDLNGVRLSKATLDRVLLALGKTTFPMKGLVVGIVIDSLGAPATGVTVGASKDNVQYNMQYLSSDLTAVDLGGSTTSSGVFVVQDAPFGTRFDAQSGALTADPSYGGLVEDKVTIVVIQMKPTVGG
jgi:hypothetical protein